jgi:type IV secretion system protein VirD4
MFDNETFRFGSARFAEAGDIAAIGMFEQRPHSVLLGFHGGKPLYYSAKGGLVLIAGARGGKLRDVLGYNVCSGICQSTMLILDPKGELAMISQNPTPDRKHCIYWNPCGLHEGALPQHRLNPVDYIRMDNPTLVSDVKVFCENVAPLSGSANGEYFELRAREIIEAIALTLTERGGVLTLPDLYRTLNLIPAGGEAWLHFAFDMNRSRFPLAVRVEAEIAKAHSDSRGSLKDIMGEVLKSFACLSDPVLMASVSPPYDFSLAQLCASDQAYQFYMMPAPEYLGAWSSIIKTIFVGAMIYKSRAPQAPQQTWVIDECAALGKFPLITQLYSYGAGMGIRPWTVYQSTYQMRVLGPDAENIILSSAALKSYFAVRDIQTATAVCRMIGSETLLYRDERLQAQAQLAKHKAMQSFMMGDGDLFQKGVEYAHYKQAADMPSLKERALRTPDEVLNMPSDKQFIFTDGLPGPIYADRKPYYEQAFMAGRFHPNPFYPPLDRVRIKTRFGHAWKRVVTAPVPPEYANYPQYRNHPYSYVEK